MNDQYLMPSVLQDLIGHNVLVDTEEKLDMSSPRAKSWKFVDGINWYEGLLKSLDNEFVMIETEKRELVAIKRERITTIRQWEHHDSGGGGGSNNSTGGTPYICDDCKKKVAEQATQSEASLLVKPLAGGQENYV